MVINCCELKKKKGIDCSLYFIDKYNIQVPEEFLKYMADRSYVFPDMAEIRKNLHIEGA